MQIYERIEQVLLSKLPLHRARIKCVAMTMLSLLKVGTVNLTSLAKGLNYKVLHLSNQRRLQRFVAEVDFNSHMVGSLLYSLLPRKTKLILCIDRTEWNPKERRINLLVASVLVRGISTPVAWMPIPLGCSSTDHRTELLQRVLRIIPKEHIEVLLADREFFGKDWFAWLKTEKIPFCIRVRKNAPIGAHKKNLSRIDSMFADLAVGERRTLDQKHPVYRTPLWITVKRIDKEYIYLVGTEKDLATLEIYAKRWSIETLFQAFKGRGFKMEDTGLKDPERVARLFGIIALAFTWSQLAGLWMEARKPRKLDKNKQYKISIFRYGMDLIDTACLNLDASEMRRRLRFLIQLLQPRKARTLWLAFEC